MAGCLPDRLPFFTCDVFTQTRYAGNPLAIVEQADALTPAQMQIIAREFNLSETIFVQSPEADENTAKVRIFFPTAEIPFAGHPTIGCALHLALKTAPPGDFEVTIRLEEQAGLVPVSVTRRAGKVVAELTAPITPHPAQAGTCPDVGMLAAAVGLGPEQIGPHQPGVWEGGPRFLYIPVQDAAALAQARPSPVPWDAVMDQAAVDSAYLYTAGENADYHARMFSPTAGIPEDPATGSASAILAAQLLANGAVPNGLTRLHLRQGVEMGRPSDIYLTTNVEHGVLTTVKIAGTAVAVSDGMLTPPA